MASKTGETAIEAGDWTYEVHEIPSGIDLYEDDLSWTPFRSAAHAHSAGTVLALLHHVSRDFNAPPRKPRPLVASFTIFAGDDPATAMSPYLAARPSLAQNKAVHASAEQALELLAPFHAELRPHLHALAPLWTHNDLHASNLFWSDAGRIGDKNAYATAIIDFGLADRTNAVHDIAHAIERNIVEWLALVNDPAHPDDVPIHLDHLDALLDGYESIRPLSVEESFALAPMVALCHAEFALSEADYFLGILHSEAKAKMAYDGWLVGHARWFASAPGRKLLDALRRRAGGKNLLGASPGAKKVDRS
jgi:Ser/Thr protein kinase RdoA (MazF antagonist)